MAWRVWHYASVGCTASRNDVRSRAGNADEDERRRTALDDISAYALLVFRVHRSAHRDRSHYFVGDIVVLRTASFTVFLFFGADRDPVRGNGFFCSVVGFHQSGKY